MLNEVKRRGIAMSLATVQRAEAAADERDQVEIMVTRGIEGRLTWVLILGRSVD